MNTSSSFPVIFRLTSILERLDFGSLFPTQQPLEIELGAGDGTFLVNYAKARPDRNFIGVERLLGRLHKISKKAARAQLLNVRALRVESAYFLEYLVPQGSVSGIHVYFPDPWPKRRHARHRLVTDNFQLICARALSAGGHVFLRTDNEPYFSTMLEVFSGSDCFAPAEACRELLEIRTDFEMDFNAKGIPTLHATFVKKTKPVG